MQAHQVPFKHLSPLKQDAATYCAQNRPKLRSKEDVPNNEYLLALWDNQPEIRPDLKEFPPYKAHKKACKLLERNPFPKWEPGTPQDIEDKLTKATSSQATTNVLDDLYHHSRYDEHRKARTCRTRNKLIAQRLGLNEKTIARAIKYLLQGHWIERPRKGVPDPQHETGYQSLYVLPFNYPHILWWRSKPNKAPRK